MEGKGLVWTLGREGSDGSIQLKVKEKKESWHENIKLLSYLPYWHKLLINHLLDPMHIFNNVSQVIWDHIIGKCDTIGCHRDFEKVNCMPHLWIDESGNKPPAPWVLSKQEMTVVKAAIKKFWTPIGTMRSLSGCFTTDDDLSRLKSHDWHKVLQVWRICLLLNNTTFYDVVNVCLYFHAT